MSALRTVRVLVCGEPMRGDDAVAEAVVDALPPATRRLSDVRVIGGLMPDHLTDADGPIILVDAVHGPPAGTIIDLPLADLPGAFDAGMTPGSSHALPLPMVLGLARAMTGADPDGRFIGVAGADFALGAPLSAAVRQAVGPGAARLNHWIRVLAHARRETSTCA